MIKNPDEVQSLFHAVGCRAVLNAPAGLAVVSPWTGRTLATLETDTLPSLEHKITLAQGAGQRLSMQPRRARELVLETFSAAMRLQRESLAALVHADAGKTMPESLAEADGFADILLKTVSDAALPDVSGMMRCKERPPVGVVGLITSFNFPLVVAGWTIAPALLAGNAVVWKPSEKTSLAALACKAVFDAALPEWADALQVIIGGRDAGEAMVEHEQVDMISATGSVTMGQGIQAALARKQNHAARPILELGGNNGVIISEHLTPEHLAWSLEAILLSFLGTTGQRCTNTRRLIVHRSQFLAVVLGLSAQLERFMAAGAEAMEKAGFGPLIDADAYGRFERAKAQAGEQGATLLLGRRIPHEDCPDAYYVEPALAVMPGQTPVMFEETFAPLLFIAPYDGTVDEAMRLLNAPDNAGLVSGIYTLNRAEAERFALLNEAGHALINSPKGTGTPAYGMGFGGNKSSGAGEILNAADPLRPFTREGAYRRIAWNAAIALA